MSSGLQGVSSNGGHRRRMSLAELGAALPGWRRLAGLVAGRAGFRIAQWVSGVGLVAAWDPAVRRLRHGAGQHRVVARAGVGRDGEKALLALGPRPGGERLPRLLVTASLLPHAAGLVALGLALSGLAVLGEDGVLWAAAGAYSTGSAW